MANAWATKICLRLQLNHSTLLNHSVINYYGINTAHALMSYKEMLADPMACMERLNHMI
jgi:hypothetical protein